MPQPHEQPNEIKNAAIATGTGAAAGAGASAAIGGVGLAIGGTAVSVGILPFVAAGAVVGLAGYGVYRLLRK